MAIGPKLNLSLIVFVLCWRKSCYSFEDQVEGRFGFETCIHSETEEAVVPFRRIDHQFLHFPYSIIINEVIKVATRTFVDQF